MSYFVEEIDSLLKEKGISRNKMLTDLKLNKNSMVDWSKRGTIPKANVVSAIAEYLDVPITILLGKSDDPETFQNFSEKLVFLMNTSGTDPKHLAKLLNISEKTILDWITGGEDTTYSQYFNELSSIFDVQLKYWYIEGVIPPGIEPTTEEYFLLMLYREYKKTGMLKEDTYGSLEHFFPNISDDKIHCKNVACEDKELLNLYHQLPYEVQIEFKGEIKGYLKAIKNASHSVAADERKSIQQAK